MVKTKKSKDLTEEEKDVLKYYNYVRTCKLCGTVYGTDLAGDNEKCIVCIYHNKINLIHKID